MVLVSATALASDIVHIAQMERGDSCRIRDALPPDTTHINTFYLRQDSFGSHKNDADVCMHTRHTT